MYIRGSGISITPSLATHFSASLAVSRISPLCLAAFPELVSSHTFYFSLIRLPYPAVKVALVILHADPARGGAERYTVDLACALAGRGHEVSLLASTFASDIPAEQQVPLAGASGISRLGRYLRFLDSLDAHLTTTRYDVVHAMLPVRRCDVYHPHAGLAVDAVQTGHLKHGRGVAAALSRLANRLNRKRQRFARVERELLNGEKPPVVLCLSDYVKGTIVRHFPALPQDRLATLFNAVDLNRFDPACHPEAALAVRSRFNVAADRVVALMIAQDYRRKGLPEAMQALAGLNDPRLVLLVVGKQDPRPYQHLAAKLKVGGRVVFAGPTADPRPFYQAADFFVLPTRHDPCSLVVLEALAMGLPVISTRFNGACEIMTEGRHGFVLSDPRDVGALAQAMGRLLDGDARRSMRQACLDFRPALSYELHVERLLRIYQSL